MNNNSKQDNVNTLLGKDSYDVVLKQISEKISTAQAETLEGDTFLKEMYTKLNESEIPMMTLKPFITGAEKVSSSDATVKEVIDFCKESILGNNDLNFIINYCKEEHIAKLRRDNHPAPKETIKSIEKEFKKPAAELVMAVRKGIFDSLNSDLLKKVKNVLLEDVEVPETNNLNESEKFLISGNMVRYTPIGFDIHDTKNDRNVILCESDFLSFDGESFSKVDGSNIGMSSAEHRLHQALNTCPYDPETGNFKLMENWDFEARLTKEGNVFINDKQVKKEHVQQLLLESVKLYANDPTKSPEGFKLDNFNRDADRFVTLMENHENIISISQLEVVKNLNENSYIIIPRQSEIPTVVTSNVGLANQNYKSYIKLCEDCNEKISSTGNVKNMFETIFSNKIKEETSAIEDLNLEIVNLSERQKKINEEIVIAKKQLDIAEPNSPAHEKLTAKVNELDKNLNENISDMQQVNEHLTMFF